YYMASSTFAIAALFLMFEIFEREQGEFAGVIAVSAEAFGFGDEEPEEDLPEAGFQIPSSLFLLAMCFGVCTLVLAGLPPLSGFLGKFAMLTAAFNPGGLGTGGELPAAEAAFVAILVLSGLATLIALLRLGMQTFWVAADEE